MLLERGNAVAARESMAAANSLAGGQFGREASHIVFFDLLSAGNAESVLCALRAHLNTWPRDARGARLHRVHQRPDRQFRLRRIETRAAYARAHLYYEEGDPNAARACLAFWLTTYPRNGLLYSQLSWHLALGDLEAGDVAVAFRLFRDAFSPDVHSGPPRAKVTDAVSFLWRWELAGHLRDVEAWRMMLDFANTALPRAGHGLFRHTHRVRAGCGGQ